MPTDTVPAVVVRDLTIRYGPPATVTAVDGLHLVAEAGEVLVVLGPNGAGKTSTIEALEGYRRPTGGHISVLGLDPIGRSPAADRPHGRHAAARRRLPDARARAGSSTSSPATTPSRSPPTTCSTWSALRAVAATPWRHLSGGEQQRLSLALALIGRPQVAFLDEPTAGVDPEGRLAIRAVVADLRRQGVCVLLTTHELAEAEKMADRIVILSAGPGRPRGDAAGADRGDRDAGSRSALRPGSTRLRWRRARGGAPVAEGEPGSLPGRGGVGTGGHGRPGHLAGRARCHVDRPGRPGARSKRSISKPWAPARSNRPRRPAGPTPRPRRGSAGAGARDGRRRRRRRRGAAAVSALVAQTRAEVFMTLRRGETLLLTVGIPVVFLIFFSTRARGVHARTRSRSTSSCPGSWPWP